MSVTINSMSHLQKTLRRAIALEGIGLHSGRPVKMNLLPALPGSGIIFVRADLPDAPTLPARFDHVKDTRLATTLGSGRVTLSTVEHLLAALQGMGVDNLVVEVFGPEVPIFDGSSIVFFEAISQVGLETQMLPRPVVGIKRRVELRVADKWAVVEPSKDLEIRVSIEWDHPVIGYQEYTYSRERTPFSDVVSARTFGFLRDVETLKRMGLAQGGSLENAIVLDEARVLNPEGLRYPDEFARHKVLDALGDFKLAGFDFQGKFRLHRPGHDLHNRLLAAIFSDPRNFEFVDLHEGSKVADKGQEMLELLASASRVAAI